MPEVTGDSREPAERHDWSLDRLFWQLLWSLARMGRTTYDFLFRPRVFQSVAASGVGQGVPSEHSPPMSFLVVSAAICTLYGYWTAKSPIGARLLLRSPLFRPFEDALGFVWKTTESLEIEKALLLMLPVVLAVVLFSGCMASLLRGFKVEHSFAAVLRINSYLAGTYLLLHGLLFSCAASLGHLGQAGLGRALLVVHLLIAFAIPLAIVRYVQLLRAYLLVRWRVIAATVVAAMALFCLTPPLLLVFVLPFYPAK